MVYKQPTNPVERAQQGWTEIEREETRHCAVILCHRPRMTGYRYCQRHLDELDAFESAQAAEAPVDDLMDATGRAVTLLALVLGIPCLAYNVARWLGWVG